MKKELNQWGFVWGVETRNISEWKFIKWLRWLTKAEQIVGIESLEKTWNCERWYVDQQIAMGIEMINVKMKICLGNYILEAANIVW